MPAPKFNVITQKADGGDVRRLPQVSDADVRIGNPALTSTGGQMLVNSIAESGRLEEQYDDETARAWASKTLSQARLEWTDHLIERQEAAVPGAPNFAGSMIKDFDQYQSKVLRNAPNEKSRYYLDSRLSELGSDIGIKSKMFEAQSRVDYRGDLWNASLQNSAQLMHRDPSQFAVTLAERKAELESANIPPIKKSQLWEKGLITISNAAVYSQIQKSPAGFLGSIGFYGESTEAPDGVKAVRTRRSDGTMTDVTGNTPYDLLPVDQRKIAFEFAIKAKAEQEADADRKARASGTGAVDTAMKDITARAFAGTLTDAIVESHRAVLPWHDYQAAKKMVINGPDKGSGDRTAVRDIETMLYNKPGEALQRTYVEHRNGNISNEFFTATVGRANEIIRQQGPKSEYERGRVYIVNAMDPGPLNPDPKPKARFAEAMDTFDRWVLSGKRTDEEIGKRAKEVVDQYQLYSINDTVIMLQHPRGTTITRQTHDSALMRAEIKRAGDKLQLMRANKQISDNDYTLEMGTLKRWADAADKIVPPAPRKTR